MPVIIETHVAVWRAVVERWHDPASGLWFHRLDCGHLIRAREAVPIPERMACYACADWQRRVEVMPVARA